MAEKLKEFPTTEEKKIKFIPTYQPKF